MYCRRRYAAAPSCTARAISRIRSFPSGWRSSQTVRPTPYPIATPAQTSANSTGWSLKKLPTISLRTPSQSPRRGASARAGFYHMARPRGVIWACSGGFFVVEQRARELERRKSADHLGDLHLKKQDGRDAAVLQ